MHNESPLAPCRAEPCSADVEQPSMARPCNSPGAALESGIEQQRQRAKRTAMWVGAIAVLVYLGFILSGVIGR
ncbi:hypothetical protein [Stenotrophomonas maltophilia]|uniref:hypothetical protein n=1 Tax=Stenotrophomonas maltophilia TaxID=40324 RepID=UPI0039C2C122